MNKLLCLLFIGVSGLLAHPMGNFSISHYSKLQATSRGVDLEYALDLAEIPTFELLRDWKLDRDSSQSQLHKKAVEQARLWLKNLAISSNATPLLPQLESVSLVIADGAGNLPILRITSRAFLDTRAGQLRYQDNNYPDRAGWKEIVIDARSDAALQKASQPATDLSKALTHYPPDPTLAPPQDLRAELAWRPITTPLAGSQAKKAKPAAQVLLSPRPETPVVAPIAQPHSAPAAPSPASMTAQGAAPGAIIRGDYLSRLLHQRELSPWLMFVALACAFALGAAHALTPGHGKSIVAAYLVGSRGTLKHAVFLGATVTATHTFAVFALGIATLFLFRFIAPERLTEILGVISGLSIVAVGAWMVRKRISGAAHVHVHSQGPAAHAHVHAHSHSHSHEHSPHHDHAHHHDHTHSHMPTELSWAGLAALGASGGLVPCESALVLLLGAIAVGHVGLGLLLLISFSAGLASVLILIGALVLYAKDLLPAEKRRADHGLFHWLLIVSPALVMIVGLVMTCVSLGWIQPKWMIG